MSAKLCNIVQNTCAIMLCKYENYNNNNYQYEICIGLVSRILISHWSCCTDFALIGQLFPLNTAHCQLFTRIALFLFFQNFVCICTHFVSLYPTHCTSFCSCRLVWNVLNGCAVGNHQMWQDVSLPVDHEYASEILVLTELLRHPNQVTHSATSTVEGRRNEKEPKCKIGFFVF